MQMFQRKEKSSKYMTHEQADGAVQGKKTRQIRQPEARCMMSGSDWNLGKDNQEQRLLVHSVGCTTVHGC